MDILVVYYLRAHYSYDIVDEAILINTHNVNEAILVNAPKVWMDNVNTISSGDTLDFDSIFFPLQVRVAANHH